MEWWADLETIWRRRREREVQRLAARAARLRRALRDADAWSVEDRRKVDRSASWAEHRATSQAMSRQHRIATCRRRWIAFGCGCQRIERPVGCDATLLCDWCRRRHLRRWRRRITRSLDAHQRGRRAAWIAGGCQRGREPAVYLLTLTIGHSGDVARDRAELWSGWRRWQKWLTAHVGCEVPYAAVWEVTAGRDGEGHVHCHIAAILPWFDWSAAGAAWRRACPRSRNADYQRTTAARAAKYVSKYVTKGVELGELSGALAGELLAAWYGKRRVSTSRRFYRPIEAAGPKCCRRCAERWRVTEPPSPLRRSAPESVWSATAELHGFLVGRGPPQVRILLAEPPPRPSGWHG